LIAGRVRRGQPDPGEQGLRKINNAGIGGGGSLIVNSREEWERTFNVCRGSVYNGTRAFLPLLLNSEEKLLLDTAAQDGKRVRIGFGKDPGQAGKNQALHLVRALSGSTVAPAPESGDKLTRFGPFSSQCRAGNV